MGASVVVGVGVTEVRGRSDRACRAVSVEPPPEVLVGVGVSRGGVVVVGVGVSTVSVDAVTAPGLLPVDRLVGVGVTIALVVEDVPVGAWLLVLSLFLQPTNGRHTAARSRM